MENNSKKTKIIAFYAAKGGTGRTLALVNIAHFLSRIGFRVCVLDMDANAPGVCYKLFPYGMQQWENKKGMEEYIYEQSAENPKPKLSDYLVYGADKAGRIAVVPPRMLNSKYRGGHMNMSHDLFMRLLQKSENEIAFDEKGMFINSEVELNFDYILIDYPSGLVPNFVTDCPVVPDISAVFSVTSPDSVRSSYAILNAAQKSSLIAILTKYERFDNINEEDEFFSKTINDMCNNNSRLLSEKCAIYYDRDIAREENLVFSLDSAWHDEKNELRRMFQIEKDYHRLCHKLFTSDEIANKLDVFVEEAGMAGNKLEYIKDYDSLLELIRFVAQEYNYPRTWEMLIRYYTLRSLDKSDRNGFLDAIKRYYNAGGAAAYVDQCYYEAFLEHFAYEDLSISEEDSARFDVRKIISISCSLSQSERLELAKVLKNGFQDMYSQDALQILVALQQNPKYTSQAKTEIISLFLKNPKIFKEHYTMVASLKAPDLQYDTNSLYRNKIFELYAKDAVSNEPLLEPICLDIENDIENKDTKTLIGYLNKTDPAKVAHIYLEAYIKERANKNYDSRNKYYEVAMNYAHMLMGYYAAQHSESELIELLLLYKQYGVNLSEIFYKQYINEYPSLAESLRFI